MLTSLDETDLVIVGIRVLRVLRPGLQWNESSQDTSGGSSHGHKMNFYKIPAMVGIFFWFRGLLETFIFFLASKVGDEKSVKWP